MPVVVAAVVLALASLLAWLARPVRMDPARRAELASAVSAVDRELAANLELLAMFDQTKQAVVLENGEYGRHRATFDRDAGAIAAAVADLYARMAQTEEAMVRRGPANTIKAGDRVLIDGWEGDARGVQRSLREALQTRPGWRIRAAIARLSGSLVSR